MREPLIKLPRNRVRRNYMGGAGIDALHGERECVDNYMPEEWVGSMVEASNPGMVPVAHEGLAVIETGEGERLLRDIVDENREYYLGKSRAGKDRGHPGFLLKILDSSMRLHVQAHPTTEFANRVMNKPYGKLECYYILGVRSGVEPYIRLGFQNAPEREAWREIIETQDMEGMDRCFEKIPVKPGEVWYIPGGMPHAIGEGITMLEIMEPSDLVVRCEFEREGIVVPEEGRFMGRGLDFCLDIFDYQEYSKEDIIEKCRITPRVLEEGDSVKRLGLVDETLTRCFCVETIRAEKDVEILHTGKFTLGVVCQGGCTLEADGRQIELRQGDSFLIAAAVINYRVYTREGVQLCIVCPGRDRD